MKYLGNLTVTTLPSTVHQTIKQRNSLTGRENSSFRSLGEVELRQVKECREQEEREQELEKAAGGHKGGRELFVLKLGVLVDSVYLRKSIRITTKFFKKMGVKEPLFDYISPSLDYQILKKYGLKLRNRIIWHFGHGLHASNRFSGRYETILWFTKTDDYIFNLDNVRVPSKYPGKRHFKGLKSKIINQDKDKKKLLCN